jgi:uncharacterized protein (DUF952 family)
MQRRHVDLMTEHAPAETPSVFKIVSASEWAAATGAGFFTGSADDVRDGFIHLSKASQLAGTAKKYFIGQHNLLLVAFDSASLAPHLRWETSRGGDIFPHYYGALPVKSALWQKPLPLGDNGVPIVDKENH